MLDTGVLFRYGFDDVRGGVWKARTFEAEFSRRLGAAYCHLCSSGTAALGIAMAACGIGAGDEVIVPTFTFIATIEGVLQAGAVPVFADIDETLCLDPESVRNRITGRTRAVVPVHMCGSMARIDELASLCAESGLRLIEDTAQAVGATFHGRSLGTFGDMGCYSFDPVKTITCGEGGAIVTDDEYLYHRAEQYADHGHDHVGSDRGAEGHPILGDILYGWGDRHYLRMVRGEGDVREEAGGPLRQLLHCALMRFPDPSGPGEKEVRAPLPEDFGIPER